MCGQLRPLCAGECQTRLGAAAQQRTFADEQQLSVFARQQVGIDVDGDDVQAQGIQVCQPIGEGLPANRDDPPAAVRQGFAMGQVQLIDVFRQQLLHGIGQRLADPARLARRQVDREVAAGLGRQHQGHRRCSLRRAVTQRQPGPAALARQPVGLGRGIQPGTALGWQEQAVHRLSFSLIGWAEQPCGLPQVAL